MSGSGDIIVREIPRPDYIGMIRKQLAERQSAGIFSKLPDISSLRQTLETTQGAVQTPLGFSDTAKLYAADEVNSLGEEYQHLLESLQKCQQDIETYPSLDSFFAQFQAVDKEFQQLMARANGPISNSQAEALRSKVSSVCSKHHQIMLEAESISVELNGFLKRLQKIIDIRRKLRQEQDSIEKKAAQREHDFKVKLQYNVKLNIATETRDSIIESDAYQYMTSKLSHEADLLLFDLDSLSNSANFEPDAAKLDDINSKLLRFKAKISQNHQDCQLLEAKLTGQRDAVQEMLNVANQENYQNYVSQPRLFEAVDNYLAQANTAMVNHNLEKAEELIQEAQTLIQKLSDEAVKNKLECARRLRIEQDFIKTICALTGKPQEEIINLEAEDDGHGELSTHFMDMSLTEDETLSFTIPLGMTQEEADKLKFEMTQYEGETQLPENKACKRKLAQLMTRFAEISKTAGCDVTIDGWDGEPPEEESETTRPSTRENPSEKGRERRERQGR